MGSIPAPSPTVAAATLLVLLLLLLCLSPLFAGTALCLIVQCVFTKQLQCPKMHHTEVSYDNMVSHGRLLLAIEDDKLNE